MKQSAMAFLEPALQQLEADGLLRVRKRQPQVGICFCSNDYLGLAHLPCPPDIPAGATASRLVAGDQAEHASLESYVAEWLGYENALLFTSGYAANVGLLSALIQPRDQVISDALNHASIIDGIRLGRGGTRIVAHLDTDQVSEALAEPCEGRRWVVTESYFGMDGDTPDLRRLRDLCDEANAGLIVDEAHALGVLGPGGRGLCAASHVQADALIGTFGKAFGAGGAFVAGSNLLARWLWNRARSLVFSTGLSPALAAAAKANLQIANADAALRDRVNTNANLLRHALSEAGVLTKGFGPIIPCVTGSAREAVDSARRLNELGYRVVAIRPPTVPEGGSRLRITVTANHNESEIRGLATAFREIRGQ